MKVYAPNIPGTIINIAGVDPDNGRTEGNEFDNDAAQGDGRPAVHEPR